MCPFISTVAEMEKDGYPVYTTSAGWLGYSDEQIQSVSLFLFILNKGTTLPILLSSRRTRYLA